MASNSCHTTGRVEEEEEVSRRMCVGKRGLPMIGVAL
jgi:hypothetical protein